MYCSYCFLCVLKIQKFFQVLYVLHNRGALVLVYQHYCHQIMGLRRLNSSSVTHQDFALPRHFLKRTLDSFILLAPPTRPICIRSLFSSVILSPTAFKKV